MNFSDSDTESDISSDSDVEKLAFQAFKFMKDKMNKQKLIETADKPASCKSGTSSHRKIYDTFQSNSDSEEELESRSDRDVKVCVDAANVGASELQFFIDKNPVAEPPDNHEVHEEDTQTINTFKNIQHQEVEVTDLSNLDAGTENKCSKDMQRKKKREKTKDNISNRKQKMTNLSTSLKTGVSGKDIYVNVNPYKKPHAQKSAVCDNVPKELEVMKKCVITEEFEKQDSVSPIESVRQKKKQRKLEREKTKGDKWFHMAAPEITEERKHDLEVLQMRKVLDPKRFYKSADIKATPKYFQFGQVVETPADFYNSRIPKKQRKSTMVEELLADVEFRQFNKRKYEEIQDMKRQGKGPYQRMKRMRKKKKQK